MPPPAVFPPWLAGLLACPRHRTPLTPDPDAPDGHLCCAHGCRYPLVHGVPVLLPREAVDFPHEVFGKTLAAIDDGRAWHEYGSIEPPAPGEIDPWVAEMVAATNSNLYRHLVGDLHHYPLPDPPFARPVPGTALDLGAGWGRWSLALARAGQRVVGIDPSLRSVLAATRVARQLGLDDRAAFVVGDARSLPFRDRTFTRAFSYSVLQHFPKPAVRDTLRGLRRVLAPGGESRLHLLNAYGIRSMQVQIGRGFRAARDFEVRYWRPGEMRRVFDAELGPSRLEVDGFLVQARPEDREVLTPNGRRLVDLSQRLTRWARACPPLARVADNLFVVTTVPPAA